MAGVKRAGPTLQDVATATGLSIATISRVLAGKKAIGDETRERVLVAAERIGYVQQPPKFRRPPRAASDQICLVIPVSPTHGSQLANPFELALIGGVGSALRDRRHDLAIVWQAPHDDRTLVAFLENTPYAGTILLGQSQFHETLNRFGAAGAPLVAWGVAVDGQHYCSVGSDNYLGGYRATRHLIRAGRLRIAFIGGLPPILAARTPFAQIAVRMDGYRAALAAHGLPFDPALVQTPASIRSDGAEAVENLLDRGIEFDAIVAASDIIALSAIQALARRGLTVPEDVAVVGYDDIDAAGLCTPGLTTIRQDAVRAGTLLVSKLFRIMDGYRVDSERLPTELIVRASCGH